MRIGLLNDFEPSQRGGGASRAIRLFVLEAQQRYAPRNVELVYCLPGSLERDCDLYINFLTKRFPDAELGFVQTRPFIECGFDWWPENETNSKWRNLLYQKARLSIFVSPLHKERLCGLYHVRPTHSLIIPPPLALEALTASQTTSERRGAAWAAEWHANKGPDLAAVLARKLDLQLDMFSPSMPPEVARQRNAFTDWAHPQGFVAEEEWYPTLAKYEKLLHTPRVPEAFGYIMLEAWALGLEVIVTGKTGVESYGLPWDEMLEQCGRSAGWFWEAVESAI